MLVPLETMKYTEIRYVDKNLSSILTEIYSIKL